MQDTGHEFGSFEGKASDAMYASMHTGGPTYKVGKPIGAYTGHTDTGTFDKYIVDHA